MYNRIFNNPRTVDIISINTFELVLLMKGVFRILEKLFFVKIFTYIPLNKQPT